MSETTFVWSRLKKGFSDWINCDRICLASLNKKKSDKQRLFPYKILQACIRAWRPGKKRAEPVTCDSINGGEIQISTKPILALEVAIPFFPTSFFYQCCLKVTLLRTDLTVCHGWRCWSARSEATFGGTWPLEPGAVCTCVCVCAPVCSFLGMRGNPIFQLFISQKPKKRQHQPRTRKILTPGHGIE